MLCLSSGPFTCVNCGHGKADSIFRVYGKAAAEKEKESAHGCGSSTGASSATSKASSKSSGTPVPPSVSHLKLTECSECGRAIDDYVELETSILLIDALLLKSRFYRHLGNCVISGKAAIKLALILVVADSLFKWSRISADLTRQLAANGFTGASSYVELEYRFYLTFADMLAQNVLVYLCMHCTFWLFAPNARATGSQVLKILILCSFVKLLNLLTVLWPAPDHLQPLVDLIIQVMLIASLVQALRACSLDSDTGQQVLTVPIAFLIVLFAKTTVVSMLYHGTGGKIQLTPANLLSLVV